jgi:glycosyltransferase involved in cell wall biosynthesis
LSSPSLSVLLVTSGWPSDEHPESSIFVAHQVDALRAAGVHVDVVRYVGAMRPRNYRTARKQVRARLATASYDLIHAHFGQSILTVIGSRLPIVLSLHGSDLFGIVGASGRYTARGRALRAITRWGARRAAAVIVPSQTLAAALPAGVAYEVVPPGVDPLFEPGDKAVARRELGLPADRPIVLFAGSPKLPVKRFELAKAAIDLLPSPGAELLTIERVSRHEVARRMVAADTLLVTSRHESGPLVVKEALATNLPVVSVDVGDVATVIGDVDGCVVCNDDTPETIARALHTVLTDERTFSGSAVASKYAQPALVHKIIELYQRTVR